MAASWGAQWVFVMRLFQLGRVGVSVGGSKLLDAHGGCGCRLPMLSYITAPLPFNDGLWLLWGAGRPWRECDGAISRRDGGWKRLQRWCGAQLSFGRRRVSGGPRGAEWHEAGAAGP